MSSENIQNLKISRNKRYLVNEDETPFFWLADTAWELFHRLNREDAVLYLENRAENGFNVIQAVALSELDGICVPNSYGRKPLLRNNCGDYDVTRPDLDVGNGEYTYWEHVDFIIDTASALGLYIALLPAWGDKLKKGGGKGPELLNGQNSKVYGRWIGDRYKERKNIIWVLGGDRMPTNTRHFAAINSMAAGIRDAVCGRHLMTFHPFGQSSSSAHFHEEGWLDFNMIQSGHGQVNFENYKLVEADYLLQPVKPTLDGETRYEDHPIGNRTRNGYFDDYDVRQACYWSVFAGGAGVTYGHNSVWTMYSGPGDEIEEIWADRNQFIMPWKAALNRIGAQQMKHLKALMESRPLLDSMPDQSILPENCEGANHLRVLRGENHVFIYIPNGCRFRIDLAMINYKLMNCYWYDPRSGKASRSPDRICTGVKEFIPPTSGRNNDWVLVIDNADLDYQAPGANSVR